jgi:hypothetical protein
MSINATNNIINPLLPLDMVVTNKEFFSFTFLIIKPQLMNQLILLDFDEDAKAMVAFSVVMAPFRYG